MDNGLPTNLNSVASANTPQPQFTSPIISPTQATAPPITSQPNITPPTQLTQTPQVEQTNATIQSTQPDFVPDQKFHRLVLETKIINSLRWLITAALTTIGFKGLYDSLYFIFIEFKQFESALINHELSKDQVNVLVLKVGLMLFSTAISLFFALQMSIFHQHRFFKWAKIVSGIIVMIISGLVMIYANQIDATALLDQLPIFKIF